MRHGHLRPDRRGKYLRTNTTLVAMATAIATLRRSGLTIRAIAAQVGASRSGVHGVLVRIGLAGCRSPRSGKPVALSQRAANAVSPLLHPCARRLTWRQRVVLQGYVRGMATSTIATDLGVTISGVRAHVIAAKRCVHRPWQRRSRATRAESIDLGDVLILLDARPGNETA